MTKLINTRVLLGRSEFYVIDKALDEPADIFAYYDRIRAYVQHEDDLVNSRLTWSLTIHGFLFAIYGILIGKIADQFVEIGRGTGSQLLLEHTISGLLFFQIPIAVFGALVGYQSREAIIAAHNAIQHLFCISDSSGCLYSVPPQTKVQSAIGAGPQTVTPDSMVKIQNHTRLLIDPGKETEEIVVVEKADDSSFCATFRNAHEKGVFIRQLGTALLPKVIGGGDDRGSQTRGARSYYLALPLYAMCVWLMLCLVSLGLCGASLFFRGRFFSFLGV